MLKRIAITGPESTGKSLLAASLANEYKTYWVPDAAPGYLSMIDQPFNENDLEIIARLQLQQEDELAKISGGFLFCAAEMLTMKIWSEDKFHRVHPFISSQLRQRKYHLYILCGADTPGEDDSFSERPAERKFLYDRYKKELELMQVKFVEVTGTNEEKVKKIISILG